MKKTKEKTIYLVRHGQSEGNVSPVFQGTDSPLTNSGRQQAQQIAKRISKLSFESLIVSPLPRTKETAEIVTKKINKKPEYSKLFIERTKPTRLAGKPHADKEANELYQKWTESLYTPGMRVEDGENFDDLIARADKALDFLKERKEDNIVVVTHGFFIRAIIIKAMLEDTLTAEAFKNFQTKTKTENTGISVLKYSTEYEGTSWRLWTYNDHAHLG